MTGFKKVIAVLLVLLVAASVGIITVNAAQTSDSSEVCSADTTIIVHARHKELAQPYLYLWNSLPTNGAMSKAYPGEKLSPSGDWFNYTLRGYTKVNALVTDADGKQYSKEYTLSTVDGKTAEFWFLDGKWTKYDPEKPDPVTSTDLRDETIYFVMTTRFYDGDSGNNVHCWDDGKAGNPDSDPAWRGDFKGLAEKLDYIKALGFTAIWVTPVVENASGYDYHGYHALNFSKVDPRYESSDFDFDDLVRAVHEKGMKIIQDVVFQHTGNFGEAHFCPIFERDYNADLADLEASMKPTKYLLDTFGLKSAEEYYAQKPEVQYQQRLNIMKNVDYPGNLHNTTGLKPAEADYGTEKLSSSDKYNPNNYYHTGFFPA